MPLALVMSRDPALTSREAADRLKAWAWREDERLDDPRWGAGKVRLSVPEAVGGGGCLGGGASAAWLPLLLVRRRRRDGR